MIDLFFGVAGGLSAHDKLLSLLLLPGAGLLNTFRPLNIENENTQESAVAVNDHF
jgi:hypothetical protein